PAADRADKAVAGGHRHARAEGLARRAEDADDRRHRDRLARVEPRRRLLKDFFGHPVHLITLRGRCPDYTASRTSSWRCVPFSLLPLLLALFAPAAPARTASAAVHLDQLRVKLGQRDDQIGLVLHHLADVLIGV